MNGIIDIGGGLRGVFGTGVFDRLTELGITFPYIIGVSAGAANITSYLSGQKGRNLPFYTEYPNRPEYMSFRNFREKGSYLDLTYVYGKLSNETGERPLDYDKMMSSDSRFITVATNALTAKAVYFEKDAYKRNDFRVLMASSCLPAVCRPIEIDDIPYFDGGVSDPIPIRKAFYDGCEKVVLIITRPVNEEHIPNLDKKAAFLVRQKYPAVSKALLCRYQLYNTCLAIAREYEKQGKVLILAPDNCDGLSTLTKDYDKLMTLYNDGREKAEKVIDFLNK